MASNLNSFAYLVGFLCDSRVLLSCASKDFNPKKGRQVREEIHIQSLLRGLCCDSAVGGRRLPGRFIARRSLRSETQRLHHKSLRCRSDIVKRKARHQGEIGLTGTLNQFDVLGADDRGANHLVLIFSGRGLEFNKVIQPHSREPAKKRVAMARQGYSAGSVGRGAPGKMPDGMTQGGVIDSFRNHRGEADSWNRDFAKWISGPERNDFDRFFSQSFQLQSFESRSLRLLKPPCAQVGQHKPPQSQSAHDPATVLKALQEPVWQCSAGISAWHSDRRRAAYIGSPWTHFFSFAPFLQRSFCSNRRPVTATPDTGR